MLKITDRRYLMSLLVLIVYIPFFCLLYGCSTGVEDTANTTSTSPANGSLTLSLNSSLPATTTNTTTTVTFGTSVYATATLKDASGAPVSGAVVTFATSSALVVFTPTTATALTNSSGTASVILNAASIDSAGATSISASAPVTTGGTASNITSTPVGIAVNGATITLGTLSLGQSPISAYGTSSVSVPVMVNGSPATTVPISVAFTSPCVTSGKATLASPVTSNAGTATSTYKDNGCASGRTSITDTITASVTTGATASATITVVPSLTLSLNSNTVAFGTPIYATATLKNASGASVSGAVVTFAASSGLVVFSPITATALTSANGTASISLDAASISAAGAASISATAQIDSSTTVTSAPVGIAVNGTTVTLGALTLGQSSISAYGTSVVSVPVLVNGAPSTTPISVTFTSPCVTSGKATLTSPVTTVAGTATSTYKDNNCATGSDVITASVTGASVNATITVAIPSTSNIQFVSATPAIIGTRGTGAAILPQSSLVKFKVVDSNNNGKAGVLVDFSLKPDSTPGGITLSTTSATSDANGEVTTSVDSGAVPTPVWVVAKVHSNPAILSQSNTLTITTGLPAQNSFSLSVQTHNIEGWNYDGVTSTITIIASDRLGNPVPDGTAINFITEGGQITPASCTTTSGTCTVTFKSSEYRPRNETTAAHPNGAIAAVEEDGVTPITINGGPSLFVKNGRVTILAYTVGEKSFVDANGNNIYDAGETFYDLGDLFLDSNENGTWDSNSTQPNLLEQYIQYLLVAGTSACMTHVGDGTTAPLPSNYADAPSKDNSCNGQWGLNYVRRSNIIILSSSSPQISQNTFSMSGVCTKTFSFWLMDGNNNPLPAGTTVTTANNSVTYQYTPSVTIAITASISVGGTPVVDSTHAGGTRVSLTVDGGTACMGAVAAGTLLNYPIGTVDIVTTTPKGVVTNKTVTVH
jgi:hypothetical protein